MHFLRFVSFTLFFLFQFCSLSSQIKSPEDFLPTHFGEHFTPHHLQVAYYEHVADQSDQVILQNYGRSNQQRPLLVAFVSSKENLDNLEQIRKDNLMRTGIIEGTPSTNIPIVWMSFGVHGNEAGGPESALNVIHKLTNKSDAEVQNWLKNTIIVLDPCINPDGNSRYTHWNWNAANKNLNPHVESREHNEPWPGGRVNHYHFDLNRDWAWQTQIESQQRVRLYNQWMPQIHVDFHEQGYNSPYYFAPAAEPFHKFITPFQRDFQTEIGQNHARYFDKNEWYYFTRERFDLFYPSYGDTWPTFNGAIGMTYEQAGHSTAGKGIILNNGDTLTIRDRIDHHTTTALSTIEISSDNASRLLKEFSVYFKNNQQNPPGKYASYVVSKDNDAAMLKDFEMLLFRQGILYSYASSDRSIRGYNYQQAGEGSMMMKEGDIVINAHQPKAILVQVLMDPEAELSDSITYDITAWSLPYAYGFKAIASKEKISFKTEWQNNEIATFPDYGDAYAYVLECQSLSNAGFMADLFKRGINLRFAKNEFSIKGKKYPRGSLIVAAADNRKYDGSLAKTMSELARKHRSLLQELSTGFSDHGKDLGGSNFDLLKEKKIMIAYGDNVSSQNYGHIWHIMENELQYPFSAVTWDDISSSVLADYDVLILPEGRYNMSDDWNKVSDWIRGGGTLIAVGNAVGSLTNAQGLSITRKERASEEDDGALPRYENRERDFISSYIPGAIVKNTMDNSHPLAYGFDNHYYSLKTSGASYDFLERGWNVGVVKGVAETHGFVGTKAKKSLEDSLSFGVESVGRGNVVYLVDNPVYRAFWKKGIQLFSNAIFFN